MILFIFLLFAHMWVTFILLDACDAQYGKTFTKKYKILLRFPIINYIFVVSKEIIEWLISYRENLKNI